MEVSSGLDAHGHLDTVRQTMGTEIPRNKKRPRKGSAYGAVGSAEFTEIFSWKKSRDFGCVHVIVSLSRGKEVVANA